MRIDIQSLGCLSAVLLLPAADRAYHTMPLHYVRIKVICGCSEAENRSICIQKCSIIARLAGRFQLPPHAYTNPQAYSLPSSYSGEHKHLWISCERINRCLCLRYRVTYKMKPCCVQTRRFCPSGQSMRSRLSKKVVARAAATETSVPETAEVRAVPLR